MHDAQYHNDSIAKTPPSGGRGVEAIILAGGLGTRLRGVIGELPKCMAPVAGKPFLYYLFRYLAKQDISRVVLSLGYKSEVVIEWLGKEQWPFPTDWVIEETPLGTGGGIHLAMERCRAKNVAVLNGDTMFAIDLHGMAEAHEQQAAEATIALKTMKNFDRYGIVRTAANGTISSFEEKAPRTQGSINGGVYLINRQAFLQHAFPQKFSFEKDYLERYVSEGRFYGWHSDSYFIDIGVPQDYEQAQQDFKTLFPEP